MENVRLIDTILQMSFEELGERNDEFKREYNLLSEIEDDSLGQWLRRAKATGEAKDSDQVLLTLMVELHRKIDELSAYIKQEKKDLLVLKNSVMINKIGFNHVGVEKDIFQKDKSYYARVNMAFFPKREVPMFIKAISKNFAQITIIHDKDRRDWNAYLMAKEREEIRRKKRSAL